MKMEMNCLIRNLKKKINYHLIVLKLISDNLSSMKYTFHIYRNFMISNKCFYFENTMITNKIYDEFK